MLWLGLRSMQVIGIEEADRVEIVDGRAVCLGPAGPVATFDKDEILLYTRTQAQAALLERDLAKRREKDQ